MALGVEEKRFINYQQIYRQTPVPPAPQAAPMSAVAKGTKVMQSRRNNYGPKGQSAASIAQAQNQNKK